MQLAGMFVQQFLANFIPPLLLKRFAAIRVEAQMAARSIHGMKPA